MSNKVTLTGHFTLLDGTPAAGTVLIRPSRSPILDLEGRTVIAGQQRFTLDAEGRFSADLPPTDDPTLGEGFTYHVMVTMEHTHWQVIGLTLPTGMVSVDVLDPPAGVVKEYPTRAEWDALTEAAVAEMEAALDEAETARDTTIDARDTAVEARDETLTARDETLTARDTAVGAAGDAESARTETFTARDATFTARDATVEARDATFTARAETVTVAGEAESARDTAVGAAGDAETARDEVAGQLAGAPRLTNLAHDTTWSASNATIDSQTARTVTFTATAQNGYIRARDYMLVGRSYYFTTEVKTTSDQVLFGASSDPIYHSGSGDWERLTGVGKWGSARYFLIQDNRSSGRDQIEVRDPVLIDLTAVFGAGREPTKEYMDALLAKHDHHIGGVDQFAVGDALQALTVTGPGLALRHDNSVGERVFLDHPGGSTMIYGDTGWRTLSSWDAEGNVTGLQLASESWEPKSGQAGGFYVRRNLDKVHIIISNLTRTSTTHAGVFASPASNRVPVGFRPQKTEALVGLRSTTEFATLSLPTNGIITRSSADMAGSNGDINITAEVEARTEWPTVLPGTPA